MLRWVVTTTNLEIGGRLPITFIRQGNLFGPQKLYDLEAIH